MDDVTGLADLMARKGHLLHAKQWSKFHKWLKKQGLEDCSRMNDWVWRTDRCGNPDCSNERILGIETSTFREFAPPHLIRRRYNRTYGEWDQLWVCPACYVDAENPENSGELEVQWCDNCGEKFSVCNQNGLGSMCADCRYASSSSERDSVIIEQLRLLLTHRPKTLDEFYSLLDTRHE